MSDRLAKRGITYQVRVSNYEEGLTWYIKFPGRQPDFLPRDGFQNLAGFGEWEFIP